jgi:preprotein translocase subunit SecF
MINFLKYRTFSAIFSCLILLTCVSAYVYNYSAYGSGFNYSVDFTGGTQVLVEFDKSVTVSALTQALEKEYQGVLIREFSDKEFIIRIKDVKADVKELSQSIKKLLLNELNVSRVDIKQVDSVSGGMGKTLRDNSIYAVVVSLLLMLVYIAVRFRSFGYAFGALVSLFHDAVVILTYFLLTYKEIDINVIGAVLVVLGYSVNDTIVIFARIRENIKEYTSESLDTIVNISLNQTLGRTIKTSVATSLVVLSLLIFGGQILRGLSVSLLIGMIFGTYSSIYMASPIMLLFNKKRKEAQQA